MKLRRIAPPEPPPTFCMEFTRDEGWAILMALNDACAKYDSAADREQWKQWAKDLDRELHR